MQNNQKTKQEVQEMMKGVKWGPKKGEKPTKKKTKKNAGEEEDYPEDEKNISKKSKWSFLKTKEQEIQEGMANLKIGSDFKLQPFDELTSFKLDNICVAFGKRRTGKTWIMRYLLFLLHTNFYHGLVITNTKFNGFWQNYFPKQVIHAKYSDELMKNFLALQKKLKKYAEEHPEKNINYWGVVVLDDVVADHHIRYSDTLHELFYNGRHYGLFVMITSQYLFGLPPGLRANADHVFILQQSQKRQREQCFEDYGLHIYDKDLFMQILDANTENRGVFCINLTDPLLTPDQVYRSWAVTDVPKFKVGHPEWWKKLEQE